MRGRKRRNDIASREFDNVVHMYRKEGASLKHIAHTYDVTAYVVRDVLVNMGVDIGPRGRPRIDHDHLKLLKTEDTFDEPFMDVKDGWHQSTQDDNALDLGDFRRPLGQ